jgi:large subunit ribosomal protein L4
MAAPKAPLLHGEKAARSVTLDAAVFASEVKPHLVHEAVRAELNAARSGTRGGKSRSEVAGGRAKPWRQKGTGRARAGSIRAPQFTGGGLAFPPQKRSFETKMNRKAHKAALRAGLTKHAAAGTLGLIDASGFDGEPSTKSAVALIETWGKDLPLVVVADPSEETLVKSFRNLRGVLVLTPAALDVMALAWSRSLLLSESALEQVQRKAAL